MMTALNIPSPQSAAEFVARTRTDTAFKARVLQVLREKGFVAMAKTFFAPTTDQMKLLDAIEGPKGNRSVFDAGMIGALESGGKIELIPVDPKLRSSLGIHVHTGGVDVDIEIDCPL
jgi:hypothetical protein